MGNSEEIVTADLLNDELKKTTEQEEHNINGSVCGKEQKEVSMAFVK